MLLIAVEGLRYGVHAFEDDVGLKIKRYTVLFSYWWLLRGAIVKFLFAPN